MENEISVAVEKQYQYALHSKELFFLNQELSKRRNDYAPILESAFRKNGLTVVVYVFGNSNMNMKITCLFFDSRWESVLEKNDMLKIWKNLGFKKVTLSDNVGYSHIFVL